MLQRVVRLCAVTKDISATAGRRLPGKIVEGTRRGRSLSGKQFANRKFSVHVSHYDAADVRR